METKFTKGEWAFQKFGKQYNLTAQHGRREIILSANLKGELVMNQDGILRPINPDHPNAKLIAAAPLMYEQLLSIVDGSAFDKESGLVWEHRLDAIREALKKATE